MKWLLFLLFAGSARAETLPQEVNDTPTREVVEYLHQEIRKDRIGKAQTHTDNVWASTNTFHDIRASTGAKVFLSTYSFGSLADFAYSSTTFASSLEGSTRTITVPGGMRVRIWAQLNIIGSADQIQMRFRVIEDGAVVGANEVASCLQSGGGGSQSQSGCSFSFERVPSSGQHTYSLQGRVGSGSVSNTSGSLNQFGVETVP